MYYFASSYDGFAGIKSEQTARGEIGAPKSIPQVQGMDTKILYPTVVGVAVLAVIVIVVTVLVLRRKKVPGVSLNFPAKMCKGEIYI